MKNRLLVMATFFVVVNCSQRNHETTQPIAGVYTNQRSFPVLNVETGDTLGTRHVRDTIFVGESSNEFAITNHRWSRNDYDERGWVSMEHSDSRPFPAYKASFDVAEKVLIPKSDLVSVRLYLDTPTGNLRINSETVYERIP